MPFLSSPLCKEPSARPRDCGGFEDTSRNLGEDFNRHRVNRMCISKDIGRMAEILDTG